MHTVKLGIDIEDRIVVWNKGSGTVNVRRMVISTAIALEDFFSCPTVCELLVAALG